MVDCLSVILSLFKVSENDVKNLSKKLDSLIVEITSLPPKSPALQESKKIPKLFSEFLRQVTFSVNSVKKINLKTSTFSLQVKIEDLILVELAKFLLTTFFITNSVTIKILTLYSCMK